MADYYKYHGLGNDYIVMDPKKTNIRMTPSNIRAICHRNLGVGSDGILYGPLALKDQPDFRIYNPDGSEAEKSGNGIRIYAQYLLDMKYLDGTEDFELRTLGGKVTLRIIDRASHTLRVAMGSYSFASDLIPVRGTRGDVINKQIKIAGVDYRYCAVTVGNPHAVIVHENPSKELACQLGPIVEEDPSFPNRTNVQFAKKIDKHNIRIEIWERGAGYTLASGSSSCAAALAAYKLAWVESPITVHMPGGKVAIEIIGAEVFLTGPVSKVMAGMLDPEFVASLD